MKPKEGYKLSKRMSERGKKGKQTVHTQHVNGDNKVRINLKIHYKDHRY